jgi:hypothetical protein
MGRDDVACSSEDRSTNVFSPLTAGRTHVAMSIRGIARFDPPGDAQRSSNSNASNRSERTDITMSELLVFLVFFFLSVTFQTISDY